MISKPLRRLNSLLRSVFDRGTLEREMQAEMRDHIERATQRLILRGIAPERVRFHTCYSINMGPRVHDMELKDIVDVILRVHAGAYSFDNR